MIRWAGYVAGMREKRTTYRLLVRKPEGRRPLDKPRHGWLDNIKMDLVPIEWGRVDWTGLAQDGHWWRALVNAIMNLRVP
jgi:hypothetical protein